jgi:hypothetical protein
MAVFMVAAVAGSPSWRCRSSPGPSDIPVIPDLNGRRANPKENRARGSGSGQMALLDIRLDFDIGTQPSTATPPGPRASPLDSHWTARNPRGAQAGGAFRASLAHGLFPK